MSKELSGRFDLWGLALTPTPTPNPTLRVLYLANAVATVLFLDAVLFSLLWPDSHPCGDYKFANECRADQPGFLMPHRSQNCIWVSNGWGWGWGLGLGLGLSTS